MPAQVAPARPSVEHLNASTAAAFTQTMAPFFEGAPGFLSRLAAARPFRDDADLFARASDIAAAMPEAEQLQLLDAHPRIGAAAQSMSAASVAEQGRDPANRSLQAQLDRLNGAYERHFGFRFVIFVAGRSRAEMVPLMGARLEGKRAAELSTALADVVAIARDRWRKAGLRG